MTVTPADKGRLMIALDAIDALTRQHRSALQNAEGTDAERALREITEGTMRLKALALRVAEDVAPDIVDRATGGPIRDGKQMGMPWA